MARAGDLQNMSYAELTKMEAEIRRLKSTKQNEERSALRKKLAAEAKKNGFDIHELFGGGRKGKGTVAAKYRDPSNPSNAWTGRGRSLVGWSAATIGGKAKKEGLPDQVITGR